MGDADNQAIGWKLRMRAAALAGLSGSSEAIEKMRRSVGELYALRSAIVHGATRRKRETAKAKDSEFGRRLAIDTLRTVMKAVIAAPRFLDPLAIDRKLLLTILTQGPDAPAA